MLIPEAIETLIIAFDARAEPFNIHDVSRALSAARTRLRDKTMASAAWADLVAFAMQAEQEDRPPWGTYFGPMGSGVDLEGSPVYFPDIESLTAEIVEHWQHRTEQLTNPVLRARYADLVWELSRNVAQRKPEIIYAHTAIDQYCAAVEGQRHSDEHEDIVALQRALQLATSIRDQQRMPVARSMLLARFHAEADKDGWWYQLYETLTSNRKCGLTVDEKLGMIARLEDLLTRFTSAGTDNAHDAERVANFLLRHYFASEDTSSIERIALAVSKAFETMAAKGSRLQAMAWLQTSWEFARRAGDQERAKRLRVAREAAIRESSSEMASFTHSQKVKKSDIEDFLDVVIDDSNWQQSLFNIAARFITPKAELRDIAKDTAHRHPLMAMMSFSVVADDHVSAKIDGDEDGDGPLYRFADFKRQTNILFLSKALDAAVDRNGLSEAEIAAFTQRTELFSYHSLIVAGIRAWLDGDYVKCLFVLVPQIEDAFRNMARRLGEAVTKEKKGQKGWEVSANLGDLLSMEAIRNEIGEDIHFWIKAIFSDARGMNLRNVVAHGLVSREAASYSNCDLIIHTMLMLGAYKDVAAACLRREARRKSEAKEVDPFPEEDFAEDEDMTEGVRGEE